MQGKIIKGIAGFYYVYTEQYGILECKAKGIFRKDKIKPLVGDNVEVELLSEAEAEGNIIEIKERKNALIRPAVANIDQALVIFAAASPEPNLNLLDRFLITMDRQQIETCICFNKRDCIDEEKEACLRKIYEPCGYKMFFISAKYGEGIDKIRQQLLHKTTTVAGPSGVGKSSLINQLQETVQMETGAISEKIQRGKHTTRHSELIHIQNDTFIMDTPGFSSLSVGDVEKEELRDCFPEFTEYEPYCRFQGCAHLKEPGCGVKQALTEQKISQMRYDNYVQIYEELKEKKKY